MVLQSLMWYVISNLSLVTYLACLELVLEGTLNSALQQLHVALVDSTGFCTNLLLSSPHMSTTFQVRSAPSTFQVMLEDFE